AKAIEADKNKLTEYGLNKPKLRLKLTGENRPPEILFGKDAALDGKMYVRFENSREAFLAGQSIKKDIDKKPEEFRDRKLTDLITAQVSRVSLTTPVGDMDLQKKGDHWETVKPLRARASSTNARANSGEVRRVLDALREEEVTGGVEDAASKAPRDGLDKPRLQLTFGAAPSGNTAETKAGEQPFATVAFGKEEGAN